MTFRIAKEDLVALVGGMSGASNEKISCSGVEYDSRNIRGGELFVCLKGETTHGHHYLSDVLSRGASMALVEDEELLRTSPDAARLIFVPDTLKAFWTIATWWRRKLNTPLVAITGSVGKTTVKELVASILLQHSVGSFSLKSFNNHVGVPYTLCRISPEHRWAVAEVGMNHPGEIATLSRVIEPDVVVVTEVQPAHIGAFSDLRGIGVEKLSIIEGLRPGGKIIVNGDNETIQSLLQTESCPKNLLRFGLGARCDLRIENVVSKGLDAIECDLVYRAERRHVRIGIPGVHNGANAACAALASLTLIPELTLDQVEGGLKAFRAPLMRLNLKSLPDGRKLLDDSYNSNPASLRALLAICRSLADEGQNVGLVIGEMRELGAFAEKYHRELGEEASRSGASFVIGVGGYRDTLLEGARGAGIPAFSAGSPEEAGELARKQSFDIVLVKGSRGVELERAVKVLLRG